MKRLSAIVPVICCVVVVVLLAILPVFVNTAIGYIPVFTVVILLALCFAYLQLLKRSIVFSEGRKNDGCIRGEALQFPLTVRNSSFLPAPRIEALFYISDIYGGEGRVDKQVLTLPPHSEKVFDLGVRFDHIGTVEVGIRRVTVFDPIGLFRFTQMNNSLHSVAILPKVIDINRVDVSDHSLRESSKNIKTFINDGMDYSGIRDYRWGDPMKSIHWKLSSKSESDYYTRLYETPTTPGLAIFMDFECEEENPSAEMLMSVYDAVVESALSTERFAAAAGYETELLFVDERGAYQRIEGPIGDHTANIMSRIPRMRSGKGDALLGLLAAEAKSANCQNNLVVCSSNITDTLVSSMISIEAPTRSPFLVAVDARNAASASAAIASGKASGSAAQQDKLRSDVKRRLNSAHLPYVVVSEVSDLRGDAK